MNRSQSFVQALRIDDQTIDRPEHFLREGLQALTSLLACTEAAIICQFGKIPAGFTGRFESTFSQPTPGKLNEFLVWASRNVPETSAPFLRAALKEENKGTSWLKTMASLRNQWAHPKDDSRETILVRVQELLQNIPEYLVQHRLELSKSGQVFWREDESELMINPFVSILNDSINCIKEREPDGAWRFNGAAENTPDIFAEYWFDLRVQDPQLQNPTHEEVISKTKQLGRSFDRESTWWSSQLLTGNAPGLITDPIPAVFNCPDSNNDPEGPLALEIELKLGATVNECISAVLGIALPPTNEELAKWYEPAGGLILRARGDNLSRRQLLQVLYWLADIRDKNLTTQLKLIISRSADQLEADHVALWNRLPDNLDSILQTPPKSKGAGLKDYLWPHKQPKRLFGLF